MALLIIKSMAWRRGVVRAYRAIAPPSPCRSSRRQVGKQRSVLLERVRINLAIEAQIGPVTEPLVDPIMKPMRPVFLPNLLRHLLPVHPSDTAHGVGVDIEKRKVAVVGREQRRATTSVRQSVRGKRVYLLCGGRGL